MPEGAFLVPAEGIPNTKVNKDAQSNLRNETNNDESSELETRIAKKFDKRRYPWLSKRTLKIKDIFLYLHSEILDFVEFVS